MSEQAQVAVPEVTTHKCEQGTPEWHDLRRGVITASVMGKLITTEGADPLDMICPDCGSTPGCSCTNLRTRQPIKGIHDGRTKAAASEPARLVVADNDTSRGLALTLAAERLSGFTEDTPMSSDMWRGRESEPYARDLYSGHYHQAEEIGFMVREFDGYEIGLSPDGLVGMDGLIEIKSPRSKTHVATILADQVPGHYMAQCQTALLVSGRSWLDFVSYVGGLPLWVKRVKPDPEWFDAITAAAQATEERIGQIVADYRNKTTNLPATERIGYNIVELKL